NNPAAVWVRGEVDEGALERTLREVVRRHGVLRTVYKLEGGQPVQEVKADCEVAMRRADLRQAGAAKAGRLEEMIGEEARRGFDLTRGPMLRVKLARVEEREWVLMVTMHHIASDGWSVEVLIKEVGALYGAYSRGEASPL